MEKSFFENHTIFIQMKQWQIIFYSNCLLITPMPINILFLKSNHYGWQKYAQINTCLTAVLLTDGSIWMHENEVQSIAYYIVQNLHLWSLVETQCRHLKWWWSIYDSSTKDSLILINACRTMRNRKLACVSTAMSLLWDVFFLWQHLTFLCITFSSPLMRFYLACIQGCVQAKNNNWVQN